MDIFETIKSKVGIKEIVERYIGPVNRNNKISCPLHHDKTPSLSVDVKNNMFKCFSAGCDFAGDGIKLVARLKSVDNFEAARIIVTDFNLNIDVDKLISKHPTMVIKTYIKSCINDVDKTDYFDKRGLSKATIKNFFLGYDVKEEAVVIPYSSSLTYYQRRTIENKSFYKPKTEDAGSEPLWNESALQRKDKTPIFVVESPICAMSIMQYGGLALSICGCGTNKLIEGIKKHKPLGTIILCLDNDPPGEKAADELVQQLKKLKVKHFKYNIAGDCKDPNELLMQKADKLCLNIQAAIKEAILISRERKDMISLEELCHLGVKEKDFIVEKMIPEGCLSMLIAASKCGKSWWVLQLAIAVVKGEAFLEEPTKKCSVLYYALEDNDARMVYRKNILTKGQPIPKTLFVKQETKTLDTGLIEELEQQIEKIPDLKLIIIDTFQMVRGQARRNESAYSFDYRELVVFRKFCADNNVAILLVHHSRKMLDENDVFNMISGSTGILGALDCGLFISKKKRMSKDDPSTLTQTGRDVPTLDRLIIKSETEGFWSKVGNPEEQEAKRKLEKYNNSPVVKTILAVMQKQTSGWSGTTRDFIKLSIDMLGSLQLGTEQEVGREITDIEIDLLNRNGIDHEVKHSNKGNRHSFFPKKRYDIFNYKQNVEEE